MSNKCRTCDKVCADRTEDYVPELAALLARHNALVEAVSGLDIPHAGSPGAGRVTVSVGVAAVDASREASHETAIRLADRALYLAKDQGRDRCVVLDRSLQVHDFTSPLRVA